MKDQTLSCLALSLVPGLGIVRLHQLLKRWGAPGEILRLPSAELKACRLSSEIRKSIVGGGALRSAERVIRETRERGISLLSFYDPGYPERLKEIHQPPLILNGQGQLQFVGRDSIAIVGSRRCSLYGREVTRKLAGELSSMGLCVVSGLARGIDTQAHLGALEGSGGTLPVLGSGVDVVYPSENRHLYQRIRQQGCLISEFPCGAFPAPQNFPIRNRIISGLCHGTVIVEGTEFSGSLITARLALEQSRELFAVPGNITSPTSYGPNYLIKQGAKIVLDRQDILEELPPYLLNSLSRKTARVQSDSTVSLSPLEQKILNLLSVDASSHMDQLIQASEINLSELNNILLHLELKNLIQQFPGSRFSRRL